MIEPTGFLFAWESFSESNSTISFEFSCQPLLDGIPTPLSKFTMETTLIVSNLNYGVTYNCSIWAVEHGKFSLPTHLAITTAENGDCS